ncbi:MAG: hypothetical protein U5M23_01235 [Marinagarivorans sp.]|nr:hypothetical protein [Marinagarivorans sp.]
MAFADMTLRAVLEIYGTESALKDWLTATKTIEEIEEKRLRNAERRGELVSRDLVKKGIIDVVNETHLKMLTDGSKSIANDLCAMVLAGVEPQKIEVAVSDRLTKFIAPGKARMLRALQNA